MKKWRTVLPLFACLSLLFACQENLHEEKSDATGENKLKLCETVSVATFPTQETVFFSLTNRQAYEPTAYFESQENFQCIVSMLDANSQLEVNGPYIIESGPNQYSTILIRMSQENKADGLYFLAYQDENVSEDGWYTYFLSNCAAKIAYKSKEYQILFPWHLYTNGSPENIRLNGNVPFTLPSVIGIDGKEITDLYAMFLEFYESCGWYSVTMGEETTFTIQMQAYPDEVHYRTWEEQFARPIRFEFRDDKQGQLLMIIPE